MEAKFSFRNRLEQVHAPARDPLARPRRGEVEVDGSWLIVTPRGAGLVVRTAAEDLRDYFLVSMGTRLPVRESDGHDDSGRGGRIFVGGFCDLPSELAAAPTDENSCRITCDGSDIFVAGTSDKEAAHGCHELENILSLRKGPFMRRGARDFVRRFSPRMIHSGWDLDIFPDNYLNKAAHAGFDSLLVYYTRANASSPEKIAEVEDLIRRASAFGMGVYLYLDAWRDYDTMHPSEPGAEAYYDSFYGRAFKNHPGAAGCVLVGESCAFPSRDPGAKDIRSPQPSDARPHPGWWPCEDYAQWLGLVKKVVTKQKPDADIVFWTYNWGWAPEEKRLALIRSLPGGTSLLVTFEMFECVRKGKMLEHCADYTIKITGPGGYFESEARTAKEKGIRLYAMSNTGGMTWDFGTAPHIPVPFQWAGRWRELLKAREKWGLCGLMESHHYGWHPSHVSRLGEYFSSSPETDRPGAFLRGLAVSEFGKAAGERLMRAWRIWSRSIGLLPATAYDQYGPLRAGPAYPLHFSKDDAPNIRSDPGMRNGSAIVEPFYAPESFFTRGPHNNIPIGARVSHELRGVRRLEAAWERGTRELEAGMREVSKNGRGDYSRILALGLFVSHTLRTLRNTKEWWTLRRRLESAPSGKGAAGIKRAMRAIASDELKNTMGTAKVLGMDSRLGWEPSAGYLADKERLEWKASLLRRVVEEKLKGP